MPSSEDHKNRLKQLFEQRSWSEQDRNWLVAYFNQQDDTVLRHLMQEQFKSDAVLQKTSGPDAERLLKQIHQKLNIDKGKKPFILKNWRPLSIAASFLLITASLYLITLQLNKKEPVITVKNSLKDIAPGHDNAILTLSDGTAIQLDNAENGVLAKEGNIKVLKFNGQLSYTGKTNKKGEVLYNTVSTARGNQYQLLLADGTLVWLNAGSSIHFPTVFMGKERKVSITGEAYFEVAKNAAMPFTVVASGTEVHVLGTHFNVNAYNDEAAVKTALAEGRVNITSAGGALELAPLQEAVFVKETRQLKKQQADIDEALAWKSGMFEFHDEDLQSIMRQIARWYDVEVIFSGKISGKRYNGSIRRQATLSQVFQILKYAGVSYTLEGRKVTVESK